MKSCIFIQLYVPDLKHRKLLIPFLLVIAFVATIPFAIAQREYIYHINSENGLPSNHIYDMLTDKNGYLWFATPKGIVRYNGYEFKKFGLQDAIPNEDIWHLYEDHKGRIWPLSISEEMGYLKNEKYHRVVLKNITNTIYPTQIRSYDSGIIFFSAFLNGTLRSSICIEKNDTIRRIEIPDSLYRNLAPQIQEFERPIELVFIKENGAIGFIIGNGIYDLVLNNEHPFIKRKCLMDQVLCKKQDDAPDYDRIGNFLIITYRNHKTSTFNYLDLNTGKLNSFNIKNVGVNENIEYMFYEREKHDTCLFYAITSGNILKFNADTGVHFIKSYAIKDQVIIGDIDGKDIKVFFEDSMWGRIIGSTSEGAIIKRADSNYFIKRDKIDLFNFKYIGGREDKIQFWWNKTTATMAKIENGSRVSYSKINGLGKVNEITPYNQDTFFLAAPGLSGICFFVNTTNKIIDNPMKDKLRYRASFIKDIISIRKNAPNSFTYIDPRNLINLKIKDDNLDIRNIDLTKYNDLIYDSVRKNYWAYNSSKLAITNNLKDSFISRDKFHYFGVQSIEKIVIDNKFGNIFFRGNNNKGESKITMYSPENNSFTELFKNYNLTEAVVTIYHNKLIVAGRFGILFTQILGPNKISNAVVYRNIKNTNYRYVLQACASWNQVLLNTDKGAYTVAVPSDSQIVSVEDNTAASPYKFVIAYRDRRFSITGNDTLSLGQKDLRLQFDLINPLGNGSAHYTYFLSNDSGWHQLSGSELTLPTTLLPGTYYKLTLKAYDEVWRSNETSIVIYIKPYWWQLLFQSKLFWAGITLLVIGLIVLIIFVSNRIITKKQVKKNLRLGLELKSVYAQINPHFIFNTLGTAMFFVKEEKMNEAYTHLAKFSKLLRSYIKSARNKYISINSEIENLENYIQLQQVRFENKFDYSIIVNSNIDASTTMIPALLLQPIVENAIDHGLFHKDEKGILKIEFSKSERFNGIQCVIDDDGIGRELAKAIARNSVVKTESYGESLIEDLVTVFNKYEKINISIDYVDKIAPLTGTTVIINIKYPTNER